MKIHEKNSIEVHGNKTSISGKINLEKTSLAERKNRYVGNRRGFRLAPNENVKKVFGSAGRSVRTVSRGVGKTASAIGRTNGKALTALRQAAMKGDSAGNAAISYAASAAKAAGAAAGAVKIASSTAIKTGVALAKTPQKIAKAKVALQYNMLRKHYRYNRIPSQRIKMPKGLKFVGKVGKSTGRTLKKVGIGASNASRSGISALENAAISNESSAALGYGMKTASALGSSARFAGRTLQTSVKLTKKSARTLQTVVSAAKQRRLNSALSRTVGNTKRSLKTAAKASKQAAKAARKAAKTSAKAAKKSAVIAKNIAKFAVQTVAKALSFLMATAPFSYVLGGGALLIMLSGASIGGAGAAASASTKGSGTWASNNNVTGEEVFENIKVLIEDSGEVLKDKTLKPLKNTVDEFCEGDTNSPRRIIQYQSNTQNVTFYPASGKNTTIDGYIDAFDIEFYPNFLAALFVLMTRDKLQAENLDETEIADFSFKKSDFEEFINTINANRCKYGETFVFKTTQVIENCYCPNQNCKRKTIPGCKCSSRLTESGNRRYYCGGHPYCPGNHTKLVVKLYTIEKLKKMDLAAIYNFTENEKIRFDGAKAFIEEMNNSYGGDSD